MYKPVFRRAGENTIFYYQAGNGLRRFNYSIVPPTLAVQGIDVAGGDAGQ